ncbi:MAG: hypothetical protein ACR2P1_24890 [Pseudomonadales bacterium]
MTDVKAKQTSDANADIVEGFSSRFNALMDRARFPSENRLSLGARRFKVTPATFKKWCAYDRIPGQHKVLAAIVDELLNEVPGHYNPKAVVAWLLAGDAVPNPFDDDGGALKTVELYFEIAEIAKRKGIEFSSLPRDAQSLIIRRVGTQLAQNPSSKLDDSVQLDDETAAMALVMMDTALSLSYPET